MFWQAQLLTRKLRHLHPDFQDDYMIAKDNMQNRFSNVQKQSNQPTAFKIFSHQWQSTKRNSLACNGGVNRKPTMAKTSPQQIDTW
ncbi:MAG: hypothetical protein ACI8UP_003276 [Porticoccaceae bacterium]|jgi:hypothetical protein